MLVSVLRSMAEGCRKSAVHPDKHDDRSDGRGKEHPETRGAPTIAVSVVGTVAMVMMVTAPAAISVHRAHPVQAIHPSDVYTLTLAVPGRPDAPLS